MNNIIKINNLSKSYNLGDGSVLNVIDQLNFALSYSCITSITGPSGSGKSTLLNILGLLDSDFSGKYMLKNNHINNLKKTQINEMRCKSIGFVHQFFHLIPELTVIENVMLPALINNKSQENAEKNAKDLLDNFGLNDRLNFKPIKLSGGEQQRVAISRSLVNNPDLILADEMTGNLDEYTADEMFNFFLNYIKKNSISLIFVTHNKKFAEMANEKYYFMNKQLIKK